ncbi:MAG: tRNA glutamyl-Q(34) synthetase GluQRS, partial [Methylococcaceae bacterium]|nr:tRNA glutamyl-Q(34) synthetase GluQRS [Methylococcaceae bacterium]
LEAFSLHWDESVFYQTRQQTYYQATIEKLQQNQLIYPCTCTRKVLAALNNHGVYPRFCRDKVISADKPHSLRVKTESLTVEFDDELQGRVAHNIASDYGDFIIKRKDNIISYQLAVVIDDELQQINHVMRGLDLLDSTPRQLYLQTLLGFKPPNYLHIPIITNQDGEKLSKQTFAKAIDTHKPEKTLFYILTLLKQPPPLELQNAPVAELLNWAIANWDVNHLKEITAIPEKSK